jgi:DNA-binding MarR family transcriptional regulator
MRLLVQALARRFQDVIEPFDITPLHWGILSCLWREDGLTTRAIADQLEQLGGTLTIGLDTMEKRKVIRRRQDNADRRISRIFLTKRGTEMKNEVVPVVEAFVAEVFACLSEAEAQTLWELINRLRAHVDQFPRPRAASRTGTDRSDPALPPGLPQKRQAD